MAVVTDADEQVLEALKRAHATRPPVPSEVLEDFSRAIREGSWWALVVALAAIDFWAPTRRAFWEIALAERRRRMREEDLVWRQHQS